MGSLGVKTEGYGSTDIHSAIPTGAIVRVQGREKHLMLSETGVTLSSCKTSCSDITEQVLPWRDVIGCETDSTSIKPDKSGHSGPRAHSQVQTATMVIHYVQHKVKNKTLRPAKIKLRGNLDYVAGWAREIQDHCAKVPGRPHKVLTIINPISGNQDGPKVYSKTMEPLFQLAGIHTTAIATERKQEAIELTENLDLAEYDGLIVVGGDGFYHEVVMGITKQMQRRSGININDPDAEFTPINIPIGVIPTGTGNAVSRWANGITDVYTAILNIIRGQKQRAQLSSVHSNGAFLCMSGVNAVYGMISDMIKRSDELRWMKTKRYPYAMLAMVLGRKRMFNCQVEYKSSSEVNHNAESKGRNKTSEDESSQSIHTDGSWRSYDPQGRRFRCLLSFSCNLVEDSEESSAVQTITSNCGRLIIDHGCFAPKLLKYLLNYISPVKSMLSTSKIHVIKDVTAFRITLTENDEVRPGSCCSSSSKDRELERLMAVDGEVIHLTKPTLDVRIRGSFVPLYGSVDQTPESGSQGGVKNRAFEPANED